MPSFTKQTLGWGTRINRASPLAVAIDRAWIVPPQNAVVTEAGSGTPKTLMLDVVRDGTGWDMTTPTGSGNYSPAVRLDNFGYGFCAEIYANETWMRAQNNPRRYGSAYTGAFTIAAWVRIPTTIIGDYGTIYSRYCDNGGDGFAFYTFNNSGSSRANTFGFSYRSSSTYQEVHAGNNTLTAGTIYLLAFSLQFGTGSSAVFYRNGGQLTATWFQNSGNAALTDDPTTANNSPEEVINDIWNEEYDTNDNYSGRIYSVMLWKRILSPAEHMQLYLPETRWSMLTFSDTESSRGAEPTTSRGISPLGHLGEI